MVMMVTALTGCTGEVIIPPVISTYYTVYINSYDGISGSLYIDGQYEGYLYPYSYVSVTLRANYYYDVSLNGIYCGAIIPSYNGQNFYIDTFYNIW